ncbi:MAG: hypothetical protein KC417_00145 [Myxococcales bacterium]|nr:hypothetical protein [Myxococcales bacterium]
MTATEPVASIEPAAAPEFATLEDAVALDPTDAVSAEALARAYLDAGHPGHAVAVLTAVSGDGARMPVVLHRLAAAYEAMGRIDDAASTARVAIEHCERAVLAGDTDGGPRTCTASQLAAYETHGRALGYMRQAGVTRGDDPRRATAYYRARLTARVAEAPAP